MVVAAPGNPSLISLLPRLLPGKKVAVIEPHLLASTAIAWGAGGRQVEVIASLEEVTNHDVLVAVNPNNPDGLLIPPEQLVSHMAGRGMVIVDEAFADLEGRALSVIPHLGQHDVIVLRSFGKSYGLAGLRLGFAVARTDLALHIRQALGPWAVSGPALHIGTDALNDQGWSARMSGQLAAEANRLDLVLRRSGLRVVGGTRLFRLAYHDDAHAIFHRLCQAGILVRKFDDRPKLLRFGIPTAEDRDRLEAALLSGR
jgi:cobalamin biosynthetic protein CobC